MKINSVNSPNFTAMYIDRSVGEYLKGRSYDEAEKIINNLSAKQKEFADYKHVDVVVYPDFEELKGQFGVRTRVLKAAVRSKEDPELQVDKFVLGGKGSIGFNVKAISKFGKEIGSPRADYVGNMFVRFEHFENNKDLDDSYNKLNLALGAAPMEDMFEYARQVEVNRDRMLAKKELASKKAEMIDSFMKLFGM